MGTFPFYSIKFLLQNKKANPHFSMKYPLAGIFFSLFFFSFKSSGGFCSGEGNVEAQAPCWNSAPAASASLCLILLHFSCWVRIFPARNHSSRWWDKGMLTRKLPGSQEQRHLYVTKCQKSVSSTAWLVQEGHGFMEKSGKNSPALFWESG